MRRSVHFAWCTGGAGNRVGHASPFGVADVPIIPDAEYIFANKMSRRCRDKPSDHDRFLLRLVKSKAIIAI